MTVYRIISPSGKSYIGITKNTIKYRWGGHLARAAVSTRRHPFYDAIRKYGPASFTFETIADGLTESEAETTEIAYIDVYQTQDRTYGYNLSDGGRYDGIVGSTAAWAAINATPETRAAYAKKLRDKAIARGRTDWTALRDAALRWRRQNPDLASERDAAGVANMTAWAKDNPEKMLAYRRHAIAKARAVIAADPELHSHRLSVGIRASFVGTDRGTNHARAATLVWANRTPEQRDTVAGVIAAKATERHANMTVSEKTAVDTQLAEARKNIDHDKRKRNQKAALTAYWTLERRAEFSAKRKGKPLGKRQPK